MSEQTVKIPAMPTTVEEFVSLRNDLATTAHGGAAMYVVALVLFSKDPEVGLQALTIAVDAKELSNGTIYKGKSPSPARVRELKHRIGEKTYVARSYIQGTSADNDYSIPSGPLEINIRQQERDTPTDERTKLFVHSTGADSPRPITLAKNNKGLWKATNYSSLDVGVRAPIVVVDDDL